MKRKCPQKDEIERGAVVARAEGAVTGADEDVYHEKLREEMARPVKPVPVKSTLVKKRAKIVNF